jgi:glucan phosphoethanolaminetransferase (alkaline phosphatase superfamily)
LLLDPELMKKSSADLWLISLIVVLLLLILAPQLLLLATAKSYLNWFLYTILPTLLLLTFLLSFSKYPHRSIWLLFPIALLAPQEFFYLSTYHKSTDAHALAIVLETDVSEASGYLAGLGGLIIAGVLAIISLFVAIARLLKRQQLVWPAAGAWFQSSRLVVWVVMAAGIWFVANEERQYAIAYPIVQKQNAAETVLSRRALPESYNMFYQSYPLNVLLAFNEYRVQKQTLRNIAKSSADFKFGASQQMATAEREIYVLVIGETLRPDRLQLNGYNRPTTPRLAGLGDVISFRDMISPWAWTRMSVPVIISRKSATDASYFFPEKSLVSAFAEAGFRTYWLSTQSPLGVHDSSVALHANEADEVTYLNPVGYKKEGYYDEVILPMFERILQRAEPKQLIVIHTLGSHFSYADRYPANFDLFQPSGKGQQLGMHDKANKVMLNNAYDNTVAYTDYILFNLIQQLRAQQAHASLLLVSDHGENIFDGNCEKSGHGHNTEFDYRVGALWWGSESFVQANTAQVNQLKRSARMPLVTTQVFHTMLDLAKISYEGERTELSFAAERFRPFPRILSSGHDFDLAAKDKICRALPAAK